MDILWRRSPHTDTYCTYVMPVLMLRYNDIEVECETQSQAEVTLPSTKQFAYSNLQSQGRADMGLLQKRR